MRYAPPAAYLYPVAGGDSPSESKVKVKVAGDFGAQIFERAGRVEAGRRVSTQNAIVISGDDDVSGSQDRTIWHDGVFRTL